MKATFSKIKRALSWLPATVLMAPLSSAFAGLPAAKAPTGGTEAAAKGDWLLLIQSYIGDAGRAMGLAIGVVGFVWTAWAAIAKFNEARTGKAEWGEVGLLAVVACGVLVFDAYILGQAASVI